MNTCSRNSSLELEWQTNFPSILMNLKDKLIAVSNDPVRTNMLPKTLTTEAVCIICVLLIFILLSTAGSSITAVEYFNEVCMCGKKNQAHDVNGAKKVYNGKESLAGFVYSANNGMLKKLKRLLKCFCFVTNGRKILSRTAPKEKEINCVHGIKAIFLTWAICIHISMFYWPSIKRLENHGPLLTSLFAKSFMKANYVNDAFFTLGGFLNAFSFFDKNRGNKSWSNFYIKKIVRIVPLYVIILGFYTTVFPYFGYGPLWSTCTTHSLCKKVWWRNLFFINNFLTAQNQCMIWTWFLACDFQLYSISPLFMVLLSRRPKLGYIFIGACIWGSCLSNFLITKHYNLTTDLFMIGYQLSDLRGFISRSFEYFNNLNQKPYARMSSYLVGILVGHYLRGRKADLTTERNVAFLYFGWITTAVFMWICFFTFGNEGSLMTFAVFNEIRHLLFAGGISWIVYVCSTGQAEFITRCLSWQGFVILSRLSYPIYLIHFLILEYYFLNLLEVGELSVVFLVTLSVCVFFWAFVASFLASVIFEMPVSRLYSMLPNNRKNE